MPVKTMSDVYMELGRKQAELFASNNVPYCECLVTAEINRTLLNLAYVTLVSQKRILAIELLPIEDKTNIWETAKEISAGRLDLPKTIELSKSLYCLEYFLNER